MRFYFSRHGESVANLTRTFSNRDAWHPLTVLGRDQADLLATSLASDGITAVYCSPAVRARQTAEIVGRALGIEPASSEALREFDVGNWEGTDAAEGWEEFARVFALWTSGAAESRVSNGESLTEIVARLRCWIELARLRHCEEDRVLVIAHGGLYRAALPRIFAKGALQLPSNRTVGYGDVVEAECSDGEMHLIRWRNLTPPLM